MRVRHTHSQNGFGLIEIVITVSVVALGFFALSAIAQTALRTVFEKATERRAIFLAEESIEVARFLRDASWDTYIASRVINVAYYPTFASTTSAWTFASTAPMVSSDFIQSVYFQAVYRSEENHDIIASTSAEATYLDENTKEIVSRVLWRNGSREIELRAYLTNIFNN